MKAILIVAVAKNNVIGKGNKLIWHLPKDLQFFKFKTMGEIVVMGRKNFESIPIKFRPLPNRKNIVITRNKSYELPNCEVFHSLSEVYAKYRNEKKIFIIGGSQIYKQALENHWVDEMYVSHIDESFEGDVFFPKINLDNWNVEVIANYFKDDDNQHSFCIKKYTLKR